MGNMALQGASAGQGLGQRTAEQSTTFDAIQPSLVRTYPGRFAVVCATRLLGVYDSVDDALLASSRAFDGGALPEGAPLLITELAERQAVRVLARPYVKPSALGPSAGKI